MWGKLQAKPGLDRLLSRSRRGACRDRFDQSPRLSAPIMIRRRRRGDLALQLECVRRHVWRGAQARGSKRVIMLWSAQRTGSEELVRVVLCGSRRGAQHDPPGNEHQSRESIGRGFRAGRGHGWHWPRGVSICLSPAARVIAPLPEEVPIVDTRRRTEHPASRISRKYSTREDRSHPRLASRKSLGVRASEFIIGLRPPIATAGSW